MSRIGKKPVPVASGVTVTLSGQAVSVKGPKGQSSFTVPEEIELSLGPDGLTFAPRADTQRARAMWGLSRTLVANMVEGVTTGFTKILELVGVGYRAETKPFGLTLQLGYSHPIEYKAPEGISLRAVSPTVVEVAGTNKEVVGQVAAEIRSLRPPEPYKGKGVKYQGEVIRRKAGKAGGK